MIDIGDPYPFRIEVRNAAGTLTNSADGVLTVTLPDGTPGTGTLTNAGTGLYDPTGVTTVAGRHEWRYVSTNPQTALTGVFDVDTGPTGIVSLADAREHLNFTAGDTTGDEELRGYILKASDWVEGKTGPVVRRTVTRTLYPTGGLLFLEPPVISLTSVVAAYGSPGTYSVGSLYLDGETGTVRYGWGATCFMYPVTVTYLAGRQVAPPLVREACLEILRAMWGSQTGPGDIDALYQGDTSGAGGDVGSTLGLARWRAERLLADGGYLKAPAIA